MKKGKQYIASDGLEYFMCPFTDMYITQGSNSSYSHKGIMANDVRGKQAGVKYAYYSPCTCKCIWTLKDYGQVMWQSLKKVHFANGRVDYATFMTTHDNSMNAYPGMVVKQGVQLGNMGDKGRATGVHCHIQVSQSADTSWFKNKYGNYMFHNEYDLDYCYFVDDTNILNGMGGEWKKIPIEQPKPKPVEPPKVDKDKLIKELQEEIDLNESKIKSLEKYQIELEDKVKLKDNEILELNKHVEEITAEMVELDERLKNYPTSVFKCANTGMYRIKLYKDEELFIK